MAWQQIDRYGQEPTQGLGGARGSKGSLAQTGMGQVSVLFDDRSGELPIVFMHGVFLDKTLWTVFGSEVTSGTHVCIDMPAQGASGNVSRNWQLDKCVEMHLAIHDEINVGCI